MLANKNFQLLSDSYLFAEVGRRVREYQKNHPEKNIIRMDIGDVTLPIISPVAEAMKKAVDEMTHSETFHGYGPEQGYGFLRDAIAENDYNAREIDIKSEDIFISDGAKCDIANLTDLFGMDCVVGIPDPVYPVYVDSNVMAGRCIKNGKIVLLDCDADNNFIPELPSRKMDIIYLCSPNNPTGGVMSKGALEKWVKYALCNDSVIIFDSAYEAFIRTEGIFKSIYEIEGAKKVAVEIRSFSKTAGFTGLRCGYTVIPEELVVKYPDGTEVQLRKLWLRRQTTKFNGASYIIQRGAEAVYSPEGKVLVKQNIDYYLRNALLLKETFEKLGYITTGGTDSPYVWIKGKDRLGSWDLFDFFLERFNISSTPGIGFGNAGEGYIRMTGFNTFENTKRAISLIEYGASFR